MIRSLLVAYDGSHGARVALQHAVDIASACQGRVILLTVRRDAPDGDGLPGDGVDLVALAEDAGADESGVSVHVSDEVLQEAAGVCRDVVVRCVARPAYGDVASVLARGSRLSDLVVMGRDASAGVGASESSARVARRVAASAECPVMVTPREYNPVRSVVGVCPASAVGARALRTSVEIAGFLQLQTETLVLESDHDTVGAWVRDVKRYLGDHGLTPEVSVRKSPTMAQIESEIGARQSPLIVVPRGGLWDTLRGQDPMSAALATLGAVVIVQP